MPHEPPSLQMALQLAMALAIGLLVGTERGWKGRSLGEGRRLAGLRTFGLTGLLGGLMGLLALRLGPLPIGLAFIGLTLLLGAAYQRATPPQPDADISITTLVALLLTFALGALATQGETALAAAAAVIATLLLGMKATLHGWLARIEADELNALLRLLLISVVVLPFLPDRGFGPWQAFNPYQLWWMVVLICAISFSGYFAVKVLGARRGLALTALFSGLASSTALTLHFARLARREPASGPLLSGGILFSCATMLPRMLAVVLLFHAQLAKALLVPFAAMAVTLLLPALLWWRRGARGPAPDIARLSNPVELRFALGFGALLSLVVIVCAGVREWLGERALVGVAVLSGIADVDAITLSLTRLSRDGVTLAIARDGIVLAAASNNLAKGTMAVLVGGSAAGWRAAVPLALSAGVGVAAVGFF
ncbi:MAG: MgtC/SapB family protein [Pseudomonadota bacterium]